MVFGWTVITGEGGTAVFSCTRRQAVGCVNIARKSAAEILIIRFDIDSNKSADQLLKGFRRQRSRS